ncbi:DegT/DnrJ/EryC1/StrS family aminotransferase [Bowmanella dokdonensis]
MYETCQLTNGGPLYRELTDRLEDYLGVSNLLLVSNGTIALQVAMRVLGLGQRHVSLTTPFSFAATSGALAWQGVEQRFSDIDPCSWNINLDKMSDPILQQANAITAVHVFGNPCRVQTLEQLACRHDLKLLFDAAHAFGVKVDGRSVLSYGDASTLSFHATKLFHTVEGGAIVFKDRNIYERAKRLSNFGLNDKGLPIEVGINGKLSEVHCAMGLAVLDSIDELVERRLELKVLYRQTLPEELTQQRWHESASDNGAYMPILLKNESQLLGVMELLNQKSIFPRRYFYPSLNKVKCYSPTEQICSVSEDISSRVLCLPLYADLKPEQVRHICELTARGLSIS